MKTVSLGCMPVHDTYAVYISLAGLQLLHACTVTMKFRKCRSALYK